MCRLLAITYTDENFLFYLYIVLIGNCSYLMYEEFFLDKVQRLYRWLPIYSGPTYNFLILLWCESHVDSVETVLGTLSFDLFLDWWYAVGPSLGMLSSGSELPLPLSHLEVIIPVSYWNTTGILQCAALMLWCFFLTYDILNLSAFNTIISQAASETAVFKWVCSCISPVCCGDVSRCTFVDWPIL